MAACRPLTEGAPTAFFHQLSLASLLEAPAAAELLATGPVVLGETVLTTDDAGGSYHHRALTADCHLPLGDEERLLRVLAEALRREIAEQRLELVDRAGAVSRRQLTYAYRNQDSHGFLHLHGVRREGDAYRLVLVIDESARTSRAPTR